MKSAGSHPKKRKRIRHTTGRASHRNRNNNSDVQPLPREVLWIIVAFVILAIIMIVYVVN
jgi:hypothetical protein